MNHAEIAAEGIRYRRAMLGHDDASSLRVDPAKIAMAAVTCGDPHIDGAIRRIGSAWVEAGMAAEDLGRPWRGAAVDTLFSGRPDLVDALDDILQRVQLLPA